MHTYFDLAISMKGIYSTARMNLADSRVIQTPNDICVRLSMETLFIITINEYD